MGLKAPEAWTKIGTAEANGAASRNTGSTLVGRSTGRQKQRTAGARDTESKRMRASSEPLTAASVTEMEASLRKMDGGGVAPTTRGRHGDGGVGVGG